MIKARCLEINVYTLEPICSHLVPAQLQTTHVVPLDPQLHTGGEVRHMPPVDRCGQHAKPEPLLGDLGGGNCTGS